MWYWSVVFTEVGSDKLMELRSMTYFITPQEAEHELMTNIESVLAELRKKDVTDIITVECICQPFVNSDEIH